MELSYNINFLSQVIILFRRSSFLFLNNYDEQMLRCWIFHFFCFNNEGPIFEAFWLSKFAIDGRRQLYCLHRIFQQVHELFSMAGGRPEWSLSLRLIFPEQNRLCQRCFLCHNYWRLSFCFFWVVLVKFLYVPIIIVPIIIVEYFVHKFQTLELLQNPKKFQYFVHKLQKPKKFTSHMLIYLFWRW